MFRVHSGMWLVAQCDAAGYFIAVTFPLLNQRLLNPTSDNRPTSIHCLRAQKPCDILKTPKKIPERQFITFGVEVAPPLRFHSIVFL